MYKPEIKLFEEKYLKEMADLFVESYNPEQTDWDKTSAEKFLHKIVNTNGEYCFEVIIDNICAGAIFVSKGLQGKHSYLLLESIQVVEMFRGLDLGKMLVDHLIKTAKARGMFGIHFLLDGRKQNLIEWYKKMGAVPTHAVEYAFFFDTL